MAGNIIPAIATTNAMTAGLCVLQAFKVMRDELDKAKMVFLIRSTERVISSESLRPPNPECPTCSVVQTTLVVDPARATLNDLVKDVLPTLGYTDEVSISSEAGVVYDPDPDFEDNLPKKLSELGIKDDSFLTIIDEQDENPRVNVVFSISNQQISNDKPIQLPGKLEIGPRPKKPEAAVANGTANGTTVVGSKRKRDAAEAETEDELIRKRGKVAEESKAALRNGDVIVLDDANDGTILIDDD
jgi:ubiquitin-like 1-activating enzyme E1 B